MCLCQVRRLTSASFPSALRILLRNKCDAMFIMLANYGRNMTTTHKFPIDCCTMYRLPVALRALNLRPARQSVQQLSVVSKLNPFARKQAVPDTTAVEAVKAPPAITQDTTTPAVTPQQTLSPRDKLLKYFQISKVTTIFTTGSALTTSTCPHQCSRYCSNGMLLCLLAGG